ncbi:MAG: GntR family transcriptional regulator, partial [Pseudomonadota bacterium]
MPRRPLYERIYDDVRDRIGRGEWAPAEAIPPEMTLARDLGASQGTVRRALDMLCDEGALVRRQGLGTFVAEQTP